jgi:IclR family acetate operon transcriptional repressor
LPAHAHRQQQGNPAFSDAETVQAALDAGLNRISERTIASAGLFRQELDRDRESGLGYDFEETWSGLVCVASPMHTLGGAVSAVAALSLSG